MHRQVPLGVDRAHRMRRDLHHVLRHRAGDLRIGLRVAFVAVGVHRDPGMVHADLPDVGLQPAIGAAAKQTARAHGRPAEQTTEHPERPARDRRRIAGLRLAGRSRTARRPGVVGRHAKRRLHHPELLLRIAPCLLEFGDLGVDVVLLLLLLPAPADVSMPY